MAKELFTTGTSGLTLEAYVMNKSGDLWRNDTHVFETPVAANWANYVIAMTEEGGAGVYVADMPSQITAAGAYPYTVRTHTTGGISVADAIYASGVVIWDGSAVATVGGNVTTLAFVKTQNGYIDTTNDAAINQLLPAVTKTISKYLRRNVLAADYVETRNGQGTDWIRTWNAPINSISQIIFDYNGLNAQTVVGSNFVFDAETAMIKFKPTASPKYGFSEGFQNIQISYNGGWIAVPDDIQTAAALVIRKLIEMSDSERLVQSKTEGLRSQTYETLYGQALAVKLSDAIFADVRQLLDPYVLVRHI